METIDILAIMLAAIPVMYVGGFMYLIMRMFK